MRERERESSGRIQGAKTFLSLNVQLIGLPGPESRELHNEKKKKL